MESDTFQNLLLIVCIHLGLLIGYIIGSVYRRRLNIAFAIWAFLIPIAGPITALVVSVESTKLKNEKELDDLLGKEDELYDARRKTGDFVSAEEVFLLNDNEDRRKAVLSILVDNKKHYIETIKLAAANSDTETSHYATATIMQVINEFQDNLSRLQQLISNENATEEEYRQYIQALVEFLDMEVMDPQLLHHYRVLLKEGCETAFEKFGCKDLYNDYIRNLIKSENYTLAMEVADRLIAQGQEDDELMLLRMNLYIESKDHVGLENYIAHLKGLKKSFSPEVREFIKFWESEDEAI